MAKKKEEDEISDVENEAAIEKEVAEEVAEELEEEGEEADEVSETKEEEIEEEGEASEKKSTRKRKEKKAVKKRKSRKEKENPLARAIRLAVETGKVEFGAKTSVVDSLLGKAKLIVIASNAPKELQEDLLYYCKLSGIPSLVFEGTSIELGSICGKPYPVSALSIYDAGSSNILEISKKK